MITADGVGCLVCMLLVFSLAGDSAGKNGDPTPEMIEQTMGPNSETVGMGGPTLKISVERTEVRLGEKCRFYVELHNERSRNLVVYMPGLIGRPDFKPAVDFHGAHLPDFVRGAYRDARKNFVVLAPGDYYGFCYEWEPPLLGRVAVSARYVNTDAGKGFGLPAWVGEVEAVKSPTVNIVGGVTPER